MADGEAQIIQRGLSFGEAPRWHGGRLWYSDFYRHGVFSIGPAGGDEHHEFTVPAQPSGLGWLPDGSLLVVSMLDQRVLRFTGGALALHCDIAPHCGFWANDMVVGADGVAYVGNFGFDLDVVLGEARAAGGPLPTFPTTNLVVIGPDGTIRQVVPELSFPNGTVITPDGRTLIVAETTALALTAFDRAPDGTLSNRRTFAQLAGVPADGICLDAEGQVWVAHPLAAECVRVREGGAVTARVTTSQNTFACALGGADRRTLYVVTAPTSNRFEIADQVAPAGCIEAAVVAVPGAGLP